MMSVADFRFSSIFSRATLAVPVAAISLCVAQAHLVSAAENPPGARALSGARAADARKQSGSEQGALQPSQQRIQQLIRDLGSPRYTERRAAAKNLRQIGAEAFDLLHAATDDSDPEIAASANYLLRQIDVRWIQPDDSSAVRAVLRQYGQESEAARLQKVEELGNLSDATGVAALCRIARFDRAPVVSRAAAIEIIRPNETSASRMRIDQDAVERELGSSTRIAATWLRQYLLQLRDPAASVTQWRQLVDEEAGRLQENAGDTSPAIVSDLMWNLADVYRQLGDLSALGGVLDRIMSLAGDRFDVISVDLLKWLTDNKSWDALDAFLTNHQAELNQSKRPLYYAALARAEQGKKDLAEQLATSAANLPSQGMLGFITAHELEARSQFDWAVREYHRSIDDKPLDGLEVIPSRLYLASMLHDYEHHLEAADVLESLVKGLQNEAQFSQKYPQICEYLESRMGLDLPKADVVACRYHYYRGCQFQAEGDYERARQSLADAIKFDKSDADVLIAMHRLPETDDAWRDSTRQRIRALADELQQKIDERPNEATNYNQWAWLISNTEGDYQKALRYSHRSLELNVYGDSGAGSYLDTLGRCYFAAGDYENAVKYERQAIEKMGYLQVMKRQLAEFEKALAEKKSTGAQPSGDRKTN